MAGDRAAESLQPGSQSGRERVCVCVERLGTGADKEPCAVCPAQRTLGGGSLHAREVLIVDRCPGWLQSYRGLVVGIGGGGGCNDKIGDVYIRSRGHFDGRDNSLR